MSFRSSSAFLVLNAGLLVAACGDSGSGGAPAQGGAGGTGNTQGGAPSQGGAGGSSPAQCDQIQMESNAKFTECGIDIGTPGTGGGGGAMAAECTPTLEANMACYRDCVLATPCGGLDGSDEAAATAFSACTIDC